MGILIFDPRAKKYFCMPTEPGEYAFPYWDTDKEEAYKFNHKGDATDTMQRNPKFFEGRDIELMKA